MPPLILAYTLFVVTITCSRTSIEAIVRLEMIVNDDSKDPKTCHGDVPAPLNPDPTKDVSSLHCHFIFVDVDHFLP